MAPPPAFVEAIGVARTAARLLVEGTVQGVGFRPFVHRLASELGLAGTVANLTGGVVIVVEGDSQAVEAFERELVGHPPGLATIARVRREHVPTAGREGFRIELSAATGTGVIGIPPDSATCAECLAEMRDPADRRYRYPFTNCTACGPRFTIIRNVPYDRARTSMAEFPLCADCGREYTDIGDRRYHAEPVACPVCGPAVELRERDGESPLHGESAWARARELLASGGIAAVKGLGGFHLACDAASDEAVRSLRARKGREEKPLAVMFRDLAAVRRSCVLTEDAERLLVGPRAPIVLLPKREGAPLAASVAPDSPTFGALLPYTPLHHLLFAGAGYDALVMTSGNRAEEPLCTSNEEAAARLGGIADAFLTHDRDIVAACDDSVVRPTPEGPIVIRRSRGWVPEAVRVPGLGPCVLAVGARMKNTFCWTRGASAYPSQHIGELDDPLALDFLERQVAHLGRLLEVTPEALACDLHPGYESTAWAERKAAEWSVPLVRVQHHHAHIASVLAEHGEDGPVIGIACDGTGWGSDGTVWGCELLVASATAFERVGHLRHVRLPGGEAAVREPWRMALAWCAEAEGGTGLTGWVPPHLETFAGNWPVLWAAVRAGLNAPLASSAGRLFDAVSALLGFCTSNAYEGQAAMRLESAADGDADALGWEVSDGEMIVLDPRPALRELRDRLRGGESCQRLAAAFHDGFCEALADGARIAAERHGIRVVAVSGGTFQNERVLLGVTQRLRSSRLRVLTQRQVPPNDGGISLGQAVVASRSMAAQGGID